MSALNLNEKKALANALDDKNETMFVAGSFGTGN